MYIYLSNMANFKVFRWIISLSINLLFLKSAMVLHFHILIRSCVMAPQANILVLVNSTTVVSFSFSISHVKSWNFWLVSQAEISDPIWAVSSSSPGCSSSFSQSSSGKKHKQTFWLVHRTRRWKVFKLFFFSFNYHYTMRASRFLHTCIHLFIEADLKKNYTFNNAH